MLIFYAALQAAVVYNKGVTCSNSNHQANHRNKSWNIGNAAMKAFCLSTCKLDSKPCCQGEFIKSCIMQQLKGWRIGLMIRNLQTRNSTADRWPLWVPGQDPRLLFSSPGHPNVTTHHILEMVSLNVEKWISSKRVKSMISLIHPTSLNPTGVGADSYEIIGEDRVFPG